MFDAYADAVNSTLSFQEALKNQQTDILNTYTYGYKGHRQLLAPSDFGVVLQEVERNTSSPRPVFIKGESLTKLSIDNEYDFAFFLVKNGDKEYLTQLGDFKFLRTQKLPDTYIGQPLEERTYLSTKEGYPLMAYPIGKGPVTQEGRYRDPFLDPGTDVLGESPIKTNKKKIGGNIPLETGPLVPVDLTRDKNGLILGQYESAEAESDGIIYGKKDGLKVPLYKIALVSVPNPAGLAQVNNTAYRIETEESGLKGDAPDFIKIRPEFNTKSNVNPKLASYDYKRLRLNLNFALSLQRSNNTLMQQFQRVLDS